VIITCILLGSKIEELDDYIPYVKHILKYYSVTLSKEGVIPSHEDIIEFERTMCKYFKWDLMRINTYTFL